MYIFSLQIWFYTAQNVRIWYSSEEAQLKDELFFNKRRCDLVSCFLSFPSHGLWCILHYLCSMPNKNSFVALHSPLLSLFSVLSVLLTSETISVPGWEGSQNPFWSHLKTSSHKADWASDGANSWDKKYIFLMCFPPCQLTQSIPLMSCSSLFW